MKLSGKLLVAGLLLIGAIVINWRYRPPEPSGVHYHAGFRIYIDGQLQDYSDLRYMNFTACSEHTKRKSAAEEQIELAHLHDGVGDVVHIHREGAKWGDLLQNAGIELPNDKPVTGYIEGVENKDILTTPIKAYTTMIWVVGDGSGVDTTQKVPIEHIQEVEAKSELCGSE